MFSFQELMDKGFSIADVDMPDFDSYYHISRACYEKDVDEFFGGWVNEIRSDRIINNYKCIL